MDWRLLGRGRMFVWSEDQAKRLLLSPKGHHQQDDGWIDEDVDLEMRWNNEEMKKGDSNPGSEAAGRDKTTSVAFLKEKQLIDRSSSKHRDFGLNKTYPESKEEKENEVESDSKKPFSSNEEGNTGDENALWVGKRLLDLGAGDGHVTQVLAAGARHVDVTEASPVMRRRLRERGYRVLDTWKWMEEAEGIEYNAITALNLLDRCDTPKTLLRDIHRKLAEDGLLVVALVLPFSPYVEIGSADNLPSEHLNIEGTTTEEQVNCLATEVFPSLGFKLEKWSRVPYLCEGDLDQAFYWLSDVVLVFKKDKESNILDSDKHNINNITDVKIEL